MIYDPWPCEDAGHCLADQIRARLAQVEDENAHLRMDLLDWQEQAEIRSLGVQMASEQRDQAFDENARLRARLAEVEAERDRERLINRGNGESAAWLNVHVVLAKERDRAEAAEARLAAVLALCDERQREIQATWGVPIGSAGRLDIADVRAAAEGDDRG